MAEKTTTDKNNPVILNLPKLPNTIQGDGRYVMSLLRSYLEQATLEINLANGFTMEDIDAANEGAVQTPRNFRLTFDRLGGLFKWDHIRDIANLAYYELRTDTMLGAQTGLLERTIDNSSTVMSNNYVDHIYLYAFDKEGQVSRPAELYYNKPRPDAPTNLSILKTQEGTLITFSDVPTNCIGAYIYIDGKQYSTVDNVYLVEEDITGVESIEVAFFDPFGEGEHGVLYLVLPDVTGFLVERNGSELDFYWDALNIYNIKYVVKVCSELSWEKGIELFRTATNDKNRRLYPNEGAYYLMVKAYDEQGNYSKNAAYQIMNTEPEINRNIILKFDQNDIFYSGSKINMYYNPLITGLSLDREMMKGEYIFNVELIQEYKARNWIEFNAFSVSNENRMMWQDANFTWEASRRQWAGVLGDLDSANFKQEIALHREMSIYDKFCALLKGELVTESGESPIEEQHADDFQSGRWALGLHITDLTRLSYRLVNVPQTFNMIFYLKADSTQHDMLLMTLANDSKGYLLVGYDARQQHFFLRGSDGKEVVVPTVKTDIREYYTIGLAQTRTERKFYVCTYNSDEILTGSCEAAPVGTFSKLYCYPKLIV